MAVLPEDFVPCSTSTADHISTASALSEQGIKLANSLAGSLSNWYQNLDDDSSIKQVLLTEERLVAAKDLAKCGTEAAQKVLGDERVKGYADHGVKVAQDVAGSVTVWYQELEPGYCARFVQWASDTWAKIPAVFSSWGPVFESLAGWFASPQAIKLFIIWISIVIVVHIIISVAGFGPAGVLAGSLAAGFQAYAYGAFTPAGSIFAFLTSMAMLRWLQPLGLAVGASLATIVTIICFFMGVGA